MHGSYLGPSYTEEEIQDNLQKSVPLIKNLVTKKL